MWCYEDSEMDELRRTLNKFPGVSSYEWCWGHNKWPVMVRFTVERIKNIDPILAALADITPDSIETEKESCWSLEVENPFGLGDYAFRLRGPIIEEADLPDLLPTLLLALRRRRKAL